MNSYGSSSSARAFCRVLRLAGGRLVSWELAHAGGVEVGGMARGKQRRLGHSPFSSSQLLSPAMSKRGRPSKAQDYSPSKSSPLKHASELNDAEIEEALLGDQNEQDHVEWEEPSEEEDEQSEEEEEEVQQAQASTSRAPGKKTKSFLQQSSGDAYLIASASASKTSSTLLSTSIYPPFTLESFTDSLASSQAASAAYSSAPAHEPSEREDAVVAKFPKWIHELEQQYSLLLYGFGSKRVVANLLAEELRKVGNVVVVEGFDRSVGIGDIFTALEGLVGRYEDDDDAHRRKRSKGKGKETAPAPVVSLLTSALTPLETRLHRFIHSLHTAPASFKPIYLVIHSLDSATFRNPKVVALLSLLAAQRRLHLVGTVDHLRSGLLWTTAVAGARGSSRGTDAVVETRGFNFVYHQTTTLRPYTTEILHSSTLSHLLPTNLFPPASAALGHTGGTASNTLAIPTPTTTIYVLSSVTPKSTAVYQLLAALQLSLLASLRAPAARSIVYIPTGTATAPPPTPIIATSLSVLANKAIQAMTANSIEQVRSLMEEFWDHGVVRRSELAPVGGNSGEGGDDEGEGGDWVWIPMGKHEVETVLEELDS